jgi:hypothetical protein
MVFLFTPNEALWMGDVNERKVPTKFNDFLRPRSACYALRDSQLLLSSSDLSHVTVKRRDAATGQIHGRTVDCSDRDSEPYFWLRDGDEIEVPEASGQ